MSKKILHITNWYPNKWNNVEGIFVKKHFNVFNEVHEADLINIQVRYNKNHFFKFVKEKYSENESGYFILTKIKTFKIIEVFTTLLLLYVFITNKYWKYNLIQCHVAYPLLIHYWLWKYIIRKPIIILEHWTAYKMNFNLPLGTTKLEGIKRIFKQNIPVITVSKALLQDIQNFSNNTNFKSKVIPNVIEKKYIKKLENNSVPIFFIVNVWRPIKNPFNMLEAFIKLKDTGKDFKLYIGGYGELIPDIQNVVNNNNLDDSIILLGKLNQKEIEKYLNICDAYLFSSKYETFSVACADALTCGKPLIGPPIPCILEYTDKTNMIIIEDDTVDSWIEKLNYFITNQDNYNSDSIANKASKYFSNNNIKKLYKEFIDEII